MTNQAAVEVQRERRGLVDWVRSYEVIVDGEPLGRIDPGETATFALSPGSHEIWLTLDWGRSEKLKFRLKPGQTARFHCAPRANLLTDIYWITFGRNRYIRLTREDASERSAEAD